MPPKTMRTAGLEGEVPGRIVTEPENVWKGWVTVNLYASTSPSRTEPPSGGPRSLPVQLTGRVIGVAVASVLPASAPVPQSFCGGRGTTVITADMLPVGSVAVMVTGVGALTGKGVMSNCPSMEPAGTVTVAGTVAARGSLPESPTVTSDVAIAVNLANPCIVVTNREASTGGGAGKTVSSAVLVTPPRDAEIVTGVGAVTAATVTLKPKVVFAFGPTNVILAGTVATPGLLLEKLTTIGVAGSGPLNVIPPAMTKGKGRSWVGPPTTLAGITLTDNRLGAAGAGAGAPFAARAGAAEPAKSVSTARAANARARTPARRPLLAPSFGDASAPLSPLRRMGVPPLVRLVSCAARPHTPGGQAQCQARRHGELWPRNPSPTVWLSG